MRCVRCQILMFCYEILAQDCEVRARLCREMPGERVVRLVQFKVTRRREDAKAARARRKRLSARSAVAGSGGS